ncbi:MAG: nicotinate phosphoribosyltransferase [Ferrimicrobium sp.]
MGQEETTLESTALLTDRYEFTMLEAALASGLADAPATFEVFARTLPPGRRFAVVGGTGRIAEAINAFAFDDATCAYLVDAGIIHPSTEPYLRSFGFTGDIWAYPEGELYFPHSPIVRIDAPFAQGLLLETLVLSMLNFDSAITTAAARMSIAARGSTLIEMGGRRTHEQAAVAAARSAYIGGFATTSNLEAGRRYQIPTGGTAGHAIILAHSDEHAAFAAQYRVHGAATTALVDTYDIAHGIRQAIEVFGTDLAAIRIDSGQPATTARDARELLDSLGAIKTQIIISGDLDETIINSLAPEPIDGFGVGTKLVTGSGAPTAGLVYKLVAIERDHVVIPVAKQSAQKISDGGRKAAYRVLDHNGCAIGEWSFDPDVELRGHSGTKLRALQVPIVIKGAAQPSESIHLSRARLPEVLSELHNLPDLLDEGDPIFSCVYQGPDLGIAVERRSR